MRRTALVLVTALLAVSCGDSPTSPSDGPLFSGTYTLDISPGDNCSAIFPGTWLAPYQFRMVPSDQGGTWRFALPSTQADSANPVGSSGNLTIELTVSGMQGAGTIGGWGLASDASRTLSARIGEQDTGRARLSGSLTSGCPASVLGTIDGLLSFGTFGLSVGTDCLSTTHRFVLRALPT